MIDSLLVRKAKNKSMVVEQIDTSWRGLVDRIKESTFRIPFKGEYRCLIKDNYIFVEGYSGLFLIDKLYYDHKTYLLETPVTYYPFKIYGVYDEKARFRDFVSDPEIGFHYLGLSNRGSSICTGEIQYVNPESLWLLKEAAAKIIKSFRVINLESLGSVILPDQYSNLKKILSNKDNNIKRKFEELLNQNMVKEII